MILIFCMKYDCKATVLSCVGGILHAGEYVELRIYSALKAGWHLIEQSGHGTIGHSTMP